VYTQGLVASRAAASAATELFGRAAPDPNTLMPRTTSIAVALVACTPAPLRISQFICASFLMTDLAFLTTLQASRTKPRSTWTNPARLNTRHRSQHARPVAVGFQLCSTSASTQLSSMASHWRVLVMKRLPARCMKTARKPATELESKWTILAQKKSCSTCGSTRKKIVPPLAAGVVVVVHRARTRALQLKVRDGVSFD